MRYHITRQLMRQISPEPFCGHKSYRNEILRLLSETNVCSFLAKISVKTQSTCLKCIKNFFECNSLKTNKDH